MKLDETLKHLADVDAPFQPSAFYKLSKLEADEVEQLSAFWPAIPVDRRRQLVAELVEIAEANFEVDFESVFRRGLHDNDPRVRVASIEGLWENEDLPLMAELLCLVQRDPSAEVRAAAALALGRFVLLGELGKIAFERWKPVYETLRDLYTDSDQVLEVRRRALESIAYVTNPEVVNLLRYAYEHPDEKMRISAVYGMGRSADERWIDTVMGELFSVNPEMRYEAARACGELEARVAVSRLAQLLDDPDREVQEAAIWALGQAGGEQARRLLEKCYYEGDEVVQSAAEAALAELEFMQGSLDFPFYELDADDLDLDEPE